MTGNRTCRSRARHRGWQLALALGAVVGLAASAAPLRTAPLPEKMPPPTLTPEAIAMGAFYNGARVRIEGTAPADSSVLVIIEGTERDEFFNRKGRIGLIWLTVDRIHVKHAPSIFLRFTSAPLGSMVDERDIQKYDLDEAAILDRIRVLSHCKCSLTARQQQSGAHDVVPDASYAALLCADFLKLKEGEGIYFEQSGAVKVVPSASGASYALVFDWPKKIPPGRYRVAAYACRGQQVIAQSAATLELAEVGFPAYMAKLASTNPWIYGIAAVLAAILAGFLTDLFTSRLQRRRKSKAPSEAVNPEAEPRVIPGRASERKVVHHS